MDTAEKRHRSMAKPLSAFLSLGVLSLFTLAACGGASGDTPGGSGGGGGNGSSGTGEAGAGGNSVEPGTRFDAAAIDWTLPAGAPGSSGYFELANSDWSTLDVDGDGRPDLVVTGGATEQNHVWKVYRNTGNGFDATSFDWAVPAGAPGGGGYFRIADADWSTLDLDGDHKPDLIVTAGATEQNRVWKMYRNTGSGFEATGVDWKLPADAPGGSGYFGLANADWSTVDLDGDRKPDLVVTAGATEQNRVWKRYANTGNGFDATGIDWALPAGAPGGSGYFELGNADWSTVDLDGDGRPDLVVTAGATEQDRLWSVFRNVP